MEQLTTKSGTFRLERIPSVQKGGLRAWDAADELLLQTVFDQQENILQEKTEPVLLINDAFGALAVALNPAKIHSWSDSFLSHLATSHNLQLNQLTSNATLIPANKALTGKYKLVIIKIPKTLGLLEDQLCRLKSHINTDTVIISAAMSKHIHSSTLKLFEKTIGTTKTSRATKKARLIFSKNDNPEVHESPHPKSISDKDLDLKLINHANVFAGNHLDIGSRFLIENLKHCPSAKHIVDLGCGNGALGIMAKRLQPEAHISFIDESYSAIASAKENYQSENKDSDASFVISNCFEQFKGEKPDLILCNPPFHQAHSIGDQIAWQMFKQSHDQLQAGGEIWVIGNRHLAYHTKLKQLFGNCRTVASNKKFVVLVAKYQSNT